MLVGLARSDDIDVSTTKLIGARPLSGRNRRFLRRVPQYARRRRANAPRNGICGWPHDEHERSSHSRAGPTPGNIRAVVPNITSDAETGIGRWTDSEIATAVREGRRPDGSIIGPPMPIALYRGISDHDLTAIVTYLRTIPPVRHTVTERSTYPFALEPYGPPVGHVPDPPDNSVARGAYIAGPLAHCMECHTPPIGVVQRDWSRMGAGGTPFEGPWGIVIAPNITSDKDHGIGGWTDDQILGAITRGIAADGRHLLPPMGARAAIYSHITDSDLRDLIAYLRSLPPR
jgi:mono/diheme cytochrome c family protein